MIMSKELIRLQDLVMEFDGERILDGINLYINDHEFLTLLGPSGCGKTTTLRIIGGFLTPTSGKVTFDGQLINDVPPYKRQINTVFQRYALFPHLDVYENVAFGLHIKKMSKEEIHTRVTEMLAVVGLKGYENRHIQNLSGGQQQRVAIARALVNEPKVLLLDEPLGALDLRLRKDMQNELKRIQQAMGITFIYVTHDQEEALSMSDTVVVMDKGRIQQIGKPEDIYNEPKNAFVADFIGESNILDGVMLADYKVKFFGRTFKCLDAGFEPNEPVDVVIRPEDIDIVDVKDGKMTGEVLSTLFKGVHYEYLMMVGRSEVVIQDTRNLDINCEASISVVPFDIHIMNKEFVNNVYDAYIDKNNNVVISDEAFECDITQLIPGSSVDEEGYLVDEKGIRYDLTDADVKAEVGLKDIEILDDEEEGTVVGEIVSIIYKGDHYQVIVRTDEDEDFVVDTEYTWNELDRVNVKIAPEKIKMTLKQLQVYFIIV